MNTAIMKSWGVRSTQNGFTAPELVRKYLYGNIYEAPAEATP